MFLITLCRRYNGTANTVLRFGHQHQYYCSRDAEELTYPVDLPESDTALIPLSFVDWALHLFPFRFPEYLSPGNCGKWLLSLWDSSYMSQILSWGNGPLHLGPRTSLGEVRWAFRVFTSIMSLLRCHQSEYSMGSVGAPRLEALRSSRHWSWTFSSAKVSLALHFERACAVSEPPSPSFWTCLCCIRAAFLALG